jgi:hypothetical protein
MIGATLWSLLYEKSFTEFSVLQYDYDFFMPKGILSQFIVQMNHYIVYHHLVWKRGVILIRDKTAAEITESYDARQIKSAWREKIGAIL